jgi:hypothetical protein
LLIVADRQPDSITAALVATARLASAAENDRGVPVASPASNPSSQPVQLFISLQYRFEIDRASFFGSALRTPATRVHAYRHRSTHGLERA